MIQAFKQDEDDNEGDYDYNYEDDSFITPY